MVPIICPQGNYDHHNILAIMWGDVYWQKKVALLKGYMMKNNYFVWGFNFITVYFGMT